MHVKIYKDLVLSENQRKANENLAVQYTFMYMCVHSLYNIILTTFWHRTVYYKLH